MKNELNTNKKTGSATVIQKNIKEHGKGNCVMTNSSDSKYAVVEIKSKGETLKTRLMFF